MTKGASEDAYDCTVMAKYGPVKAKFKSTLTLSNINAPVSYTLSGRGQGGAAGFGEGVADVMLEETGNGTVLRYTAKFNAGGRIAQVGSRLIVATTRKLADNFFSAFSSGFDAAADDATADDATGKSFRQFFRDLFIWLRYRCGRRDG